MKTVMEEQDIQAIAERVASILAPLLFPKKETD